MSMTYKEALRMVTEAARNTATKTYSMATEHYFQRLCEAVAIVDGETKVEGVPDVETIRQWVFTKEDEFLEEGGGYDQEESWVSSGMQLDQQRLAELVHEIMVTGRLP
jgi:hypothetical protein